MSAGGQTWRELRWSSHTHESQSEDEEDSFGCLHSQSTPLQAHADVEEGRGYGGSGAGSSAALPMTCAPKVGQHSADLSAGSSSSTAQLAAVETEPVQAEPIQAAFAGPEPEQAADKGHKKIRRGKGGVKGKRLTNTYLRFCVEAGQASHGWRCMLDEIKLGKWGETKSERMKELSTMEVLA